MSWTVAAILAAFAVGLNLGVVVMGMLFAGTQNRSPDPTTPRLQDLPEHQRNLSPLPREFPPLRLNSLNSLDTLPRSSLLPKGPWKASGRGDPNRSSNDN